MKVHRLDVSSNRGELEQTDELLGAYLACVITTATLLIVRWRYLLTIQCRPEKTLPLGKPDGATVTVRDDRDHLRTATLAPHDPVNHPPTIDIEEPLSTQRASDSDGNGREVRADSPQGRKNTSLPLSKVSAFSGCYREPHEASAPIFLWCTVVWARSQVINLLPLSQIGGDLYRIERSSHYLGTKAESIPAAAGIIAAERIIGLVALLCVAAVGIVMSFSQPAPVQASLLTGLCVIPVVITSLLIVCAGFATLTILSQRSAILQHQAAPSVTPIAPSRTRFKRVTA